MAKKLKLHEWGAREFAKAPHRNTLYRWVRDGWIFPIPRKRGRDYYCEPHARFVGPNPDPGEIAKAYENAAA